MRRALLGAVLVGGSIGYFIGRYLLVPQLRKREVYPYNG